MNTEVFDESRRFYPYVLGAGMDEEKKTLIQEVYEYANRQI